MEVLVRGTGGAAGWPEAGCRCASCLRAAIGGGERKRSYVVIGGTVVLGVAGVQARSERNAEGGGQAADGYRVWELAQAGTVGYRVRELADAGVRGDRGDGGEVGGWEVTGPDGGRVLYPARPGAVPVPPDGAAAYDVAFLDMLGDPTQLGRLRREGLITADTIVAMAFADHRVPGEAELRRRCGFWHVLVPADGDRITTVRSDKKELPGAVRAVPWRVLVLGGARSGKSEEAELRLVGEPDVTYVATGPDGVGDPEWAARVAAHRARRPAWWQTAETTDLAAVLGSARGAVLIDGIGTWLAAVMDECGAWDGTGDAERLAERISGVVGAWRQTRAHVVAVSDEVGLGVVPDTASGRRFRDELGRLNQALAAESEEAEMVVAGRVLALGSLGMNATG